MVCRLPTEPRSNGHKREFRGLESNQRLHVQGVASRPTATAPESKTANLREGGVEPPPPGSKPGGLPVSRFPNEAPRKPVPLPIDPSSRGGRGGSRTLKAFAEPFSRRSPSPIGLPFRQNLFGRESWTAPGAGIEPADSSLTVRRVNQLTPPRSGSKCPAGIEPARPPWRGGRLPLHHGHTCRRRIVKESGYGRPAS